MKKQTLVYYDGGNTCLHNVDKTRNQIIKDAKANGQIGFLSGYRYWNNDTQTVICFFKDKKPADAEIKLRRSNGFRAARWHNL